MKKKKVLRWLRRQSYQLEPEYYYTPQGAFSVNHYRRLKRLYISYGLEGVNGYFLKRGFAISKLKEQ